MMTGNFPMTFCLDRPPQPIKLRALGMKTVIPCRMLILNSNRNETLRCIIRKGTKYLGSVYTRQSEPDCRSFERRYRSQFVSSIRGGYQGYERYWGEQHSFWIANGTIFFNTQFVFIRWNCIAFRLVGRASCPTATSQTSTKPAWAITRNWSPDYWRMTSSRWSPCTITICHKIYTNLAASPIPYSFRISRHTLNCCSIVLATG